MTHEPQGSSKLEASRELMRDMALPPEYHLGTDPDGKYMVVRASTSEVFSVEVIEEDLPMLVVDLWREYIQTAPAEAVARIATIMTAVDALISHDGELNGGPRDVPVKVPHKDGDEEFAYECVLYGAGGDSDAESQGLDNDPIGAILKARRELVVEDATPEHPPEDEDPDDIDDEEFADMAEEGPP